MFIIKRPYNKIDFTEFYYRSGGAMAREGFKIIQITEFFQDKVVFELDVERLAGCY